MRDSVDENEFDDPALKATLRRACPRPAAPDALRRRVIMGMAAAAAFEAAATGKSATAAAAKSGGNTFWRLPRTPWQTLGVASILAAAVLSWTHVLWDAWQQAPQVATADHGGVAGALVDWHEVVVGEPEQLRSPAVGESVPLAAEMRRRGWTLRGLSRCPIAGAETRHTLWARGGETVSVFAMSLGETCPAAGGPSGDGRVEASAKGHVVLQFAHGGDLYHVVGSAGADGVPAVRSVEEVRDLIRVPATRPAP